MNLINLMNLISASMKNRKMKKQKVGKQKVTQNMDAKSHVIER